MKGKRNTILNILGIIFCFAIFAVSILYVEQYVLLTLSGILGCIGVSFFVYLIVASNLKSDV